MGIVLGIIVLFVSAIGILGDLFVGALKALTPLLILFLVINALVHHQKGNPGNISNVLSAL